MKNAVAVNTTAGTFVTDASAPGVVVLKTRADVEKLDTKVLLALFNSRRATPLKKFDSRAIGIERVLKLINEDTEIHLPVAATKSEAAAVTKPTEAAHPPKAKTEKPAPAIPVGKPETAPAQEKKTRVRVEGEPAVNRIIAYGHDKGTFSLADAEKDLGIKATCMRTHMSFINSNGVRFGDVKFIGDRKTKTYTFRLPQKPPRAKAHG